MRILTAAFLALAAACTYPAPIVIETTAPTSTRVDETPAPDGEEAQDAGATPPKADSAPNPGPTPKDASAPDVDAAIVYPNDCESTKTREIECAGLAATYHWGVSPGCTGTPYKASPYQPRARDVTANCDQMSWYGDKVLCCY